MSLFSTIFNASAIPVLSDVFDTSLIGWEAGDEIVTVINLNTREQVRDCMFQGDNVEANEKVGLQNVILSTVWVPARVTSFQQEHKLLIVFTDGTKEEFTVSACGVRQGAFRKIELKQIKTTRTRTGVSLTQQAGGVQNYRPDQ